MLIDAKRFEEAVGRPPEQDDLHRANCNEVGNTGHYLCGWCNTCDRPRFECGHFQGPPIAKLVIG